MAHTIRNEPLFHFNFSTACVIFPFISNNPKPTLFLKELRCEDIKRSSIIHLDSCRNEKEYLKELKKVYLGCAGSGSIFFLILFIYAVIFRSSKTYSFSIIHLDSCRNEKEYLKELKKVYDKEIVNLPKEQKKNIFDYMEQILIQNEQILLRLYVISARFVCPLNL